MGMSRSSQASQKRLNLGSSREQPLISVPISTPFNPRSTLVRRSSATDLETSCSGTVASPTNRCGLSRHTDAIWSFRYRASAVAGSIGLSYENKIGTVLMTWTSTPVASISFIRTIGSKQFGSTVRKNFSPTYMSTLVDAAPVWPEGPLLDKQCDRRVIQSSPFCSGDPYNFEKSGRLGGIIWVCISIRRGTLELRGSLLSAHRC